MKPIDQWSVSELNEFLAVNLMGWTWCPPYEPMIGGGAKPYPREGAWKCNDGSYRLAHWSPATDPTTALRDVVPAMEDRGWEWNAGGVKTEHQRERDFRFIKAGVDVLTFYCDTLEEALCRAAVAALQAEGGGV